MMKRLLLQRYIGAVTLVGRLARRLGKQAGDESYSIERCRVDANNVMVAEGSTLRFEESSGGGFAAFDVLNTEGIPKAQPLRWDRGPHQRDEHIADVDGIGRYLVRRRRKGGRTFQVFVNGIPLEYVGTVAECQRLAAHHAQKTKVLLESK